MRYDEIANEDFVRIIELMFEGSDSGGIDYLLCHQFIHRIASWEGEAGSEPEWMREGDAILTRHHYKFDEKARELKGYSEEDFAQLSIVERACAFDAIGMNESLRNTPTPISDEVPANDQSKEQMLISHESYGAYTARPASIVFTDFLPDHSRVITTKCTACNETLTSESFSEACNWLDEHNEKCA